VPACRARYVQEINCASPFYAGSEGVTYTVETSADLLSWSTDGVTLSDPDANHQCMASVPLTGFSRYLRVAVSIP